MVDLELTKRHVRLSLPAGSTMEALGFLSDQLGINFVVCSSAREAARRSTVGAGQVSGPLGEVLTRLLAPAGLHWDCNCQVVGVYAAALEEVQQVSLAYRTHSPDPERGNRRWGGTNVLSGVEDPATGRVDCEAEFQAALDQVRQRTGGKGPALTVKDLGGGDFLVQGTRRQHRLLGRLLHEKAGWELTE